LLHPEMLEFYQAALDYGYIFVNRNGRHAVRYNAFYGNVPRMVFCLFNPTTDITAEEQVHHIDFVRLNDHPTNLKCVSREEHGRLHYEHTIQTISPPVLAQIKQMWRQRVPVPSIVGALLNHRGVENIDTRLVHNVLLNSVPYWRRELKAAA
jgi:hypothetical protein